MYDSNDVAYAVAAAGYRSDPGFELGPQLIVIERVDDALKRYFLLKLTVADKSKGLDLFILDSKFNTSTNAIVANSGNTGTVSKFGRVDWLAYTASLTLHNRLQDQTWRRSTSIGAM
jgi:hypothetical protein